MMKTNDKLKSYDISTVRRSFPSAIKNVQVISINLFATVKNSLQIP